jgi:hypothetical protein
MADMCLPDGQVLTVDRPDTVTKKMTKKKTEKLKIYGWQSFRSEAGKIARGGHTQTKEIVAAKSKAAAARAAGYDNPRQMFNLHETGNDADIAMAMSHPGDVIWTPLDDPEKARRWFLDSSGAQVDTLADVFGREHEELVTALRELVEAAEQVADGGRLSCELPRLRETIRKARRVLGGK